MYECMFYINKKRICRQEKLYFYRREEGEEGAFPLFCYLIFDNFIDLLSLSA